jgi:hypothetical protein
MYRSDKEDMEIQSREKIKELHCVMFDRFCKGKEVFDFGTVQYKHLEEWGLLDINDYMGYMDKARAHADLEAMSTGIRAIFKSEIHEENIILIAKLYAVKELFRSIRKEGVHISVKINEVFNPKINL